MRSTTLLATLAALTVLLGLLPSAARAAVAFRAASCGQSSNVTNLTLPVPSGTVDGDLLVASVGVSHINSSLTTPSGWTQAPGLRGLVNSEQELVTWYRFATAPIPPSYTFTATGTPDGLAGGILAFSGVWRTTPISGTPGQTIQSSITTSDTLPNSTGTYVGSMRLSAAGSDDLTTSTYAGGLTKSCDEANGTGVDISTSIAWQSTGVGTTASRTVSRSDNARSVLHTLVLNSVPCSTGGLTLTAPTSISFPTTALSGVDQTAASTINLTVDDQTGDEAGWALTATSTAFTNGSYALPVTAATVQAASATAASGNCQIPTNTITYPATVPAGAVAPTASKIYNAALSTGRGASNVDLDLGLTIPGHARAGGYTSTWTFTLVSGP